MKCYRGGIWTFVVCRRQVGWELVLGAAESLKFFWMGCEKVMAGVGVLVANNLNDKVLRSSAVAHH